ncbi:hypothetical protein FGG08_006864 [Glutinoglossum americanum]|uniref:NB-ARC domain-containing protein n=1 Tax=Glutinoglossum americanum TaxID=1670608 RepID=A0A9P8KZX7_9PEZI|nr:hypothetical protein FGG08_006864 [Glutinoglossum americanum]
MSIQKHFKACISSFKNVDLGYRDHSVNRTAVAELANQYDRLNLWAHDVKVWDIERTLTRSSSLRSYTAQLLSELQEGLSSNSSSVEEFVEDIKDIVDCLIGLEPALTDPAPLDDPDSSTAKREDLTQMLPLREPPSSELDPIQPASSHPTPLDDPDSPTAEREDLAQTLLFREPPSSELDPTLPALRDLALLGNFDSPTAVREDLTQTLPLREPLSLELNPMQPALRRHQTSRQCHESSSAADLQTTSEFRSLIKPRKDILSDNIGGGQDEYDVDFEDNRVFVAFRWNLISQQCRGSFSATDLHTISEFGSVTKLGKHIRDKIRSANPPSAQLFQIWPAVSTLKAFSLHFTDFMMPQEVDVSLIWGVLYLIVSLLLESESELKLSRIIGILIKLRGFVELFIHCIRSNEEKKEINEIRFAMVDVLATFAYLFVNIMKYLREHSDDDDATRAWTSLQRKSLTAVLEIDEVTKHLHNIAAFTKLTTDRQSSYIRRRNAMAFGDDDSPRIFPCDNLPHSKNERFYGREDVLKKIEDHLDWHRNRLDWHRNMSLRIFTIYGRHGVGKTQIALEYAHRNISKFDAIFWVRCETSASLRQSFTDIAINLNLRGAVKSGLHEENLLLVHEWLKNTNKHWLLIFDNAENETMDIYWPTCKGAVLITSRVYYNFNNDASTAGETIKVFNEQESWEILIILLDWSNKLAKDEILQEELQAAKTLLQRIGGRDTGKSSSQTMLFKVTPSSGLTTAIQELSNAKLIKKEGRNLSVHRVVQEAFTYLSTEGLQDAFDSAVRLFYEAFPKQVNGRPLYPEWQRCQRYIQGSLFLAHRFAYKLRKMEPPVRIPQAFVKLLANCAWYLYEIGDHIENLQILEIAYESCEDKESLLCAHLRNTAGVSYFELNSLTRARECLQKSLAIRESLLDPDNEEVANTINNLGLVESAKGELEAAMRLFDRAEEIRAGLGDESTSLLGITYLSKGRTLHLMGNFEQAIQYLESAEALFIRTVGPNSQLMAYFHYAYGNLERSQKNQKQAKRAYNTALEILLDGALAHALTSSTLYKLGCIEASQGNTERAKTHLERALKLAELRKSGSNDGNIARILWKMGAVLSENIYASLKERQIGEELKSKAMSMRRAILLEKVFSYELIGTTAIEETEAAYDNLVCGIFR